MATKSNHGERIATLEAQLKNEAQAIRDHIDAKHELILANLQPYLELKKTVEKHTDQISFWRGSIAALSFAFTAVLTYFGFHRQ